MNKQTEDYIILKPIAERFNRVAETISDDDIKYIIKSCIKERLLNVINFNNVSEIIEDVIAEKEDEIKDIVIKSIKDRVK